MVSNIKSLAINATDAIMTIAKVERIKCHRSSSRWSKNDISFELSFIIVFLLLLGLRYETFRVKHQSSLVQLVVQFLWF